MKSSAQAFIALLLLASLLRADDIVLANGRTVSGRIVEEKDGVVRIMRPAAILTLQKSEITAIVRGPSEFDEYFRRSAALANDAIEGRLELAAWCKARGHTEAARIEFERALKFDPDNATAQRALGRERIDGQWMTSADAVKAKGLLRRNGRWVTKDEAARLDAKKAESARLAKLERELNVLVGALFTPSEVAATKAEGALTSFIAKAKISGLAHGVAPILAQARAWREDARRVRLDIDLQKADIVAMRTADVPLAQGTSVKIQLPELRRVSVGGTVVVPVR